MANATKLYDLVVKTGEYQSNGQTKSRYENIGSVMRNENGQFMMLKRTFNPAGVPNSDGRDSVLISMFEPRSGQGNDQRNQSSQQSSGSSGYGGGYGGGSNIQDDEIPW